MSAILKSSKYNPAVGGHAPGDVREAFVDATEAYARWKDGAPEPTVTLREQQLSISAVCGLLWNCSDFLPNDLKLYLGVEYAKAVHRPDDAPHTYAQGARMLKAMVRTHTPSATTAAAAAPEEVARVRKLLITETAKQAEREAQEQVAWLKAAWDRMSEKERAAFLEKIGAATVH